MGQFGDDLRKEREYRGITLFSITEATKIGSRHLEALEQEQFEQLPGGVFNKGIVRGYARVVGLDEEVWVERFMAAFAARGLLKDDDADWVRFAQNVGNTRPNEKMRPDMRLRWAGVVVLLLALAGLGWFVWHYVRDRAAAENRISASPRLVLGTAVTGSGMPGPLRPASHSLQPAPGERVIAPLG